MTSALHSACQAWLLEEEPWKLSAFNKCREPGRPAPLRQCCGGPVWLGARAAGAHTASMLGVWVPCSLGRELRVSGCGGRCPAMKFQDKHPTEVQRHPFHRQDALRIQRRVFPGDRSAPEVRRHLDEHEVRRHRLTEGKRP